MNMQRMLQEAQKLQKELQKTQKELSNGVYTGCSSLVEVTINGDKEVKSVKISSDKGIDKDDIELLEDMIAVAFNDAVKKSNNEKEKKLGKYGQGLSGLM